MQTKEIRSPKLTAVVANGKAPNDNPLRTEVVTVTPEMARVWLDRRPKNRLIRMPQVERYAADMKAGRWELSHQGIAFDNDGLLTDGQHRLSAVVLAGVPTDFQVSYGVRVDSEIDRGINRTTADILTLRYGRDMKSVAAIVRQLLGRGYSGTRSVQRVPDADIDAVYQRHADAIHFAEGCMNKYRRGVTDSILGAVCARAFYHEAHDRIEQFVHVAAGAVNAQGEQESAAVRYAFRVMEATRPAGVKYAMAESAMKAFCEYRALSKLYPASRELYPLPEESAA